MSFAALALAVAVALAQQSPSGSANAQRTAPTVDAGAPEADRFLQVPDSQELTVARPTGQQVVSKTVVPPGFQLTIFAEDPLVRQPIAMSWDARGRLWVAENYTYADQETRHDLSLFDRILIFEDADGDGRADRRRVFWDGAQRLTSIEQGDGGLWAMCPPNLLFLPDADGDDQLDGPPVVVLDGWEAENSRHNFANGLRWGPDGWLYGRSGILTTSHVGEPGSDPELRTAINCGIWRYEPRRKKFEVVCHGTTNPWGMDWDEHGELFFINTVIGHLWHVLPGARYQRMYGSDFNPHLYELMPQTADHFHWDASSEPWTAQRTEVTRGTDLAGGGHAHSGMLIYLGGQWPNEYHNDVLTVNLHGRRLNRDHLERHGATYVGRHRPDVVTIEDPWFRGIDLTCGPDGAVYVIDWSDIGECHDDDGVHRTSGRIYRLAYTGAPIAPSSDSASRTSDISRATSDQLVSLQAHSNQWYVRQARRLLGERARRGEPLGDAADQLRTMLTSKRPTPERLNALWALHAIQPLTPPDLIALLSDSNEHMRAWAVQLLGSDQPLDATAYEALAELAERETSGLVLCHLIGAMNRTEPSRRSRTVARLAQRAGFADDPVYPLLLWYAIEPLPVVDSQAALDILVSTTIPKIRRFLARRITSEVDRHPQLVSNMLDSVTLDMPPADRLEILRGISDAFAGRYQVDKVDGWDRAMGVFQSDAPPEAADLARRIAVVFGDGRAIDELLAIVTDASQPIEVRRQSVLSLGDARPDGLMRRLRALITDEDLGDVAVRAMGGILDERAAETILDRFAQLSGPAQVAAIELLASRGWSSERLLDAVDQSRLARDTIPPHIVRQMQMLNVAPVNQRIQQLWPELRLIDQNRLDRIAELRRHLEPDLLSLGNAGKGRVHFRKLCAQCHRLFDDGENVGPNLTGSQRDQLAYWLENVVDPSAVVGTGFRMSLVQLDDGRTLSGVVTSETEQTLTLRTPTDTQVIDRGRVESIQPSELSLMPDGLFDSLTPEQLRDLVAYLMSPHQVALPE